MAKKKKTCVMIGRYSAMFTKQYQRAANERKQRDY